MTRLIPVSAGQLSSMLAQGEVQLIDIREADEYARERIGAGRNVPLSRLGDISLADNSAVIFTCRTGNRTAANADQLCGCVCEPAYVLEGGLDAWKAAGLPTVVDRSKPIELMRQVQMIAGGLVLLGVVLGFVASPIFYAISAFVGAGLMVAGITGFCGMARLLMLAPWNRSTQH